MTAMAQQQRGKGKIAQMFGRRPPKHAPRPPDVSQPVDQEQIDLYWAWLNADCPSTAKHMTGMTALLLEACQSSDAVRLGALSMHSSEWIRLGVAGNPCTPSWVMWGDGLSTFGLAEDSSPWVSATVLIRHPRPPADVVEAIRSASMNYQPAQAGAT